MAKLTPRSVNFTNILLAAFMRADKQLFALLQSVVIKAVHKDVDEIVIK